MESRRDGAVAQRVEDPRGVTVTANVPRAGAGVLQVTTHLVLTGAASARGRALFSHLADEDAESSSSGARL